MKKLLAILLYLVARVLVRVANWCSATAGDLLAAPTFPGSVAPPHGGCIDCGGLTFQTKAEFDAHIKEKHSK